jgi:NADPH:quinone reductase-like Zn-dependent oxidoreductase
MKRNIAVGTLCSAIVVSLVSAAAFAAAGTMKAGVITDGTIKVESLPIPEPAAGQVRVKVRAVSVNPVDWKIAMRAAPGSKQVAGRDMAGVIDAVGESAGPWKVGDEIIGIAQGGSYAEYVLASTKAIAIKPKKMSFDESAGLPIVAETAYRAIITVADTQKGQRVLIHGGAGGVGSQAVQIAKARGAYVIATASARNHEFLRSLGADETIDYTTTRFEDKVKNLDVVVNTADADTNARSVGVVKQGGILVSIVGAPPADACTAAKIRCAVTGSVNGEMLPKVVELADAGKLKISIEKRMPMSEAAKAWELNRAGHTRGKIILDVSS